MRFKALLCDVLAREFYYWSSLSKHVIDIELISSEYHEYPKDANKILQVKIDNLDEQKDKYSYILIGYGLCGNVLENLESRSIPLVIPRAHDCITLFMGSKKKYEDYFRNNSRTMYYVQSWIERNGIKKERKELESIGMDGTYEDYVKKYGEEAAQYLIELASAWENRYNKALYLYSDLTKDNKSLNYSREVEKIAMERKWSYSQMKGDSLLIKKMVWGEWNDKEFLVVDKHSKIYHTVDENIIDFIKSNYSA